MENEINNSSKDNVFLIVMGTAESGTSELMMDLMNKDYFACEPGSNCDAGLPIPDGKDAFLLVASDKYSEAENAYSVVTDKGENISPLVVRLAPEKSALQALYKEGTVSERRAGESFEFEKKAFNDCSLLPDVEFPTRYSSDSMTSEIFFSLIEGQKSMLATSATIMKKCETLGNKNASEYNTTFSFGSPNDPEYKRFENAGDVAEAYFTGSFSNKYKKELHSIVTNVKEFLLEHGSEAAFLHLDIRGETLSRLNKSIVNEQAMNYYGNMGISEKATKLSGELEFPETNTDDNELGSVISNTNHL